MNDEDSSGSDYVFSTGQEETSDEDSFYLPSGITEWEEKEEARNRANAEKNEITKDVKHQLLEKERPASPWKIDPKEAKPKNNSISPLMDSTWIDKSYFHDIRKKTLAKSVSDSEPDKRNDSKFFDPIEYRKSIVDKSTSAENSFTFNNQEPGLLFVLSSTAQNIPKSFSGDERTLSRYSHSPPTSLPNSPQDTFLKSNILFSSSSLTSSPGKNTSSSRMPFSPPLGSGESPKKKVMNATSSQFTPMANSLLTTSPSQLSSLMFGSGAYPPPPFFQNFESETHPTLPKPNIGYMPAYPRSPKWQYKDSQPPVRKREEKKKSQWKVKSKDSKSCSESPTVSSPALSEEVSQSEEEHHMPPLSTMSLIPEVMDMRKVNEVNINTLLDKLIQSKQTSETNERPDLKQFIGEEEIPIQPRVDTVILQDVQGDNRLNDNSQLKTSQDKEEITIQKERGDVLTRGKKRQPQEHEPKRKEPFIEPIKTYSFETTYEVATISSPEREQDSRKKEGKKKPKTSEKGKKLEKDTTPELKEAQKVEIEKRNPKTSPKLKEKTKLKSKKTPKSMEPTKQPTPSKPSTVPVTLAPATTLPPSSETVIQPQQTMEEPKQRGEMDLREYMSIIFHFLFDLRPSKSCILYSLFFTFMYMLGCIISPTSSWPSLFVGYILLLWIQLRWGMYLFPGSSERKFQKQVTIAS